VCVCVCVYHIFLKQSSVVGHPGSFHTRYCGQCCNEHGWQVSQLYPDLCSKDFLLNAQPRKSVPPWAGAPFPWKEDAQLLGYVEGTGEINKSPESWGWDISGSSVFLECRPFHPAPYPWDPKVEMRLTCKAQLLCLALPWMLLKTRTAAKEAKHAEGHSPTQRSLGSWGMTSSQSRKWWCHDSVPSLKWRKH
jgi:hypothetical protein